MSKLENYIKRAHLYALELDCMRKHIAVAGPQSLEQSVAAEVKRVYGLFESAVEEAARCHQDIQCQAEGPQNLLDTWPAGNTNILETILDARAWVRKSLLPLIACQPTLVYSSRSNRPKQCRPGWNSLPRCKP